MIEPHWLELFGYPVVLGGFFWLYISLRRGLFAALSIFALLLLVMAFSQAESANWQKLRVLGEFAGWTIGLGVPILGYGWVIAKARKRAADASKQEKK